MKLYSLKSITVLVTSMAFLLLLQIRLPLLFRPLFMGSTKVLFFFLWTEILEISSIQHNDNINIYHGLLYFFVCDTCKKVCRLYNFKSYKKVVITRAISETSY